MNTGCFLIKFECFSGHPFVTHGRMVGKHCHHDGVLHQIVLLQCVQEIEIGVPGRTGNAVLTDLLTLYLQIVILFLHILSLLRGVLVYTVSKVPIFQSRWHPILRKMRHQSRFL